METWSGVSDRNIHRTGMSTSILCRCDEGERDRLELGRVVAEGLHVEGAFLLATIERRAERAVGR